MAAGLGFKDFTTGEVLTAADVDGYLMQGIWVFASAAARDAAVTSPQEGNACYLKDTNQVLTYSGSAWVVVGGGSPLTTKGDVYGFSTVDARIPVGANDTVLTADSTQALGLKWATPASGGMTLISTTTLTGSTVTLSSIPQTYKNLQLVFVNTKPADDAVSLLVRVNGDSNTNRYRSTQFVDINLTAAFNIAHWIISQSLDNAVATSLLQLEIPNYTNSVTWKTAQSFGITNNSTTSTSANILGYIHAYNQTDAVTSLEILPSSGNWTSGTVLLYGVS